MDTNLFRTTSIEQVVSDVAGKSADGEVEWRAFETAARAEMSGWDNANVELIHCQQRLTE